MSDRDSVTATVRVTFVMEFQTGSWGPRCDMAQVVSQAREQAKLAAARVLIKTDHLISIARIGPISIHLPDGEIEAGG